MTANHLLRLALLCTGLLASAAHAIGLGDLIVHSSIGEPLRAELPLVVDGERPDAACFSLAPLPGADLPVVSGAHLRLVRLGTQYRLVISGGKPINEPIAVLNLRAACGIDLQREYLVLPSPPLAMPAAPDTSDGLDTPPPPRPRARPPRPAMPRDDVAQADIPSLPVTSAPARTPRATPRQPLPRDTLAQLAGGQDRIVLGAALDDLPPPAAGEVLAAAGAIEERLLKMETTLHLLNQQVSKLADAAALQGEARSLREKLRTLQAPPLLAGTAFVPPANQIPPRRPSGNWLELALGIVLGGSVSAIVAHLVSQRSGGLRPFTEATPRVARPAVRRP